MKSAWHNESILLAPTLLKGGLPDDAGLCIINRWETCVSESIGTKIVVLGAAFLETQQIGDFCPVITFVPPEYKHDKI